MKIASLTTYEQLAYRSSRASGCAPLPSFPTPRVLLQLRIVVLVNVRIGRYPSSAASQHTWPYFRFVGNGVAHYSTPSVCLDADQRHRSSCVTSGTHCRPSRGDCRGLRSRLYGRFGNARSPDCAAPHSAASREAEGRGRTPSGFNDRNHSRGDRISTGLPMLRSSNVP